MNKRKDLLLRFKELYKLMMREGGQNWRYGIEDIIATLSQNMKLNDSDNQKDIEYVKQRYLSMYDGTRSFSDFHIWREDFNERQKENKKLEHLIKDIEGLIDIDS